MFEQLASAEFQIGSTEKTVTVEHVPYTWDSNRGGRDEQAAYAVVSYIGEHRLTEGKPITLRWVSSKQV